MSDRDEFLGHLWESLINSHLDDTWIDNTLAHCERKRDEPFGDTGAVLSRLLAAGASRRDLSLLARAIAYEAVFGTLYAVDDPGFGQEEEYALFEGLLGADPSGMEGRPGSAGAA